MAATTTRRKSKPKQKVSVRAADLPAKKPIPVSNDLLRELAKKCPPPQSWFDEPEISYVPAKRKNRG